LVAALSLIPGLASTESNGGVRVTPWAIPSPTVTQTAGDGQRHEDRNLRLQWDRSPAVVQAVVAQPSICPNQWER
jgi:hypothetical protein